MVATTWVEARDALLTFRLHNAPDIAAWRWLQPQLQTMVALASDGDLKRFAEALVPLASASETIQTWSGELWSVVIEQLDFLLGLEEAEIA